MRVLLLGATGTIGHATARALVDAGHGVTCLVRKDTEIPGAEMRRGDVTDPACLADLFAGEGFDAVVSCLASRTGMARDAWAIDHDVHAAVLADAARTGTAQFVLLSALCVQKPQLAFQQAKLAFEGRLQASGLDWSIVRPTAFFKSLSGQVARVRDGKPFLLFGDGRLTACKPISDGDLGAFLAGCLTEPARRNRILPIGGPGPAITPRDQGEALFRLLGHAPRFRHVPVRLMDGIVGGLSLLGRVSGRMADKAELARIGRYYATESMLVWDADAGRYDAGATPEFGTETLFGFYEDLLAGRQRVDLGDHAVF